jgi:hypothetical protein
LGSVFGGAFADSTGPEGSRAGAAAACGTELARAVVGTGEGAAAGAEGEAEAAESVRQGMQERGRQRTTEGAR